MDKPSSSFVFVNFKRAGNTRQRAVQARSSAAAPSLVRSGVRTTAADDSADGTGTAVPERCSRGTRAAPFCIAADADE